jgi:hypothetical protein
MMSVQSIINLPEASISHGQGCRTSAFLGLYNLVTAKLDTYDQGQ